MTLIYAIFVCWGAPCTVGGTESYWYWPTEEACIGQLQHIKAEWDRIPKHNESVLTGTKLHVVGSKPDETFVCAAITQPSS